MLDTFVPVRVWGLLWEFLLVFFEICYGRISDQVSGLLHMVLIMLGFFPGHFQVVKGLCTCHVKFLSELYVGEV